MQLCFAKSKVHFQITAIKELSPDKAIGSNNSNSLLKECDLPPQRVLQVRIITWQMYHLRFQSEIRTNVQ